MIELSELVAWLRASADQMPLRLRAEHEHNAHTVAAEAAEYIGHEIPEWRPLAASTVKEKTDLGFVGRYSATDPLLRTGEMRDSIEGRADHDGFVVGSTSKKALWQEMGTSRGIPPRPFLALALMRNTEHLADRYGRLAAMALIPPGTNARLPP